MKVKKIMTAVLLTGLIAFGGCFKDEARKDTANGVIIERDGKTVKVVLKENVVGSEFVLNKIFDKSEINSGENLKIVKNQGKETIVAITNVKKEIKAGEVLFTIENSIEALAVTLTDVVKKGENEQKAISRGTVESLLGDFDNDGRITALDFNMFVDVYGALTGDAKYNTKYDISNAAKGTSKGWESIYATNTPDGKVNIFDFTIFGSNYGMSKPETTVTPLSISLTGASTVEANKTITLSASVTYSDSTVKTETLDWSSSDTTIATVANGVVTGLKAGTVTITAAKTGTSISNMKSVTVTQASTFDGIKIHVKGYTHVWAWDTAKNYTGGTWPGIAMTAEGNSWYGWSVTGLTSLSILFSNSGSGQTPNLSIAKKGEFWYIGGVFKESDPDIDITAPVLKASPEAGNQEPTTLDVVLTATDNQDVAAKIYYTIDGTTPTQTSTLFATKITLTKDTVIKAIAVDKSGNISSVATYSYKLNMDATAPVVTPTLAAGKYQDAQNIKLSIVDNRDSAPKLYYSIDGTLPLEDAAHLYSSQTITADKTMSIKTIAIDASGNRKEETFRYVIGLAAAGGDFRNETIYFVITPRFMDGDPSNNVHCWDDKQAGNPDTDPAWRGDFKGLTDKLDYIKALGFSAIWVTPPVKNISGYDYHGYHAVNFKEIDPRYKTKYDTSAEESYQKFIDAAHAKGMKVIQDIVLNHSGNFGEENIFPMFKRKTVDPYMNETINDVIEKIAPEGRLPANYDTLLPGYQYGARINAMKEDTADTQKIYHHEKTLSWESYTVQTGQIAGDCVDLNTENPIVSKYLNEAYNKYIDMGVDSFRIDTTKHISRLTFNKEFNPVFKARGGKDFYMFGEVCTRYHGVWNSGIPAISTPFYTWAENKEYPWSTLEERVASAAANYNDNTSTGAQRKSENARLVGNEYHTPDYSQTSNLNVIDFPMHWAFKEAKAAFTLASSDDDRYYNDSTWNVTYVDSHDYAPDGAPENQRFAGSQVTWAENLDLLFAFRGIPCILYGSEIEFMKGSVIDVGPNAPLSKTGRAYFGDNLDGTVTATDFTKYSATGKVAETLNYPLSKHIQRLNLLRRELPALQKGQYSLEGVSGNIAFKRRYTDTTKGIDNFVLVTISGTATFTGIPNGTYTDAITGTTVAVSAGSLTADCTGQGNMRIYVLNGTGKIGEDGAYLK